MTPSVVYALTRDELWHWYKSAWTRGLWVFHAGMILGAIATVLLLRNDSDWVNAVISGAFYGFVACLVMVGYPQLLYRAEERTLTLEEVGLRGRRGKTEFFVPWAQIAKVEDDGTYVVITGQKRNAFVVPVRAFVSGEARTTFVRFAADHIGIGR